MSSDFLCLEMRNLAAHLRSAEPAWASTPHGALPVESIRDAGKRRRLRLVRAVFVGIVAAAALSGCGVFCGGAGGSGSAFAGGCATGMRF